MNVKQMDLNELVKVCESIVKDDLETTRDRILSEWDKVYGSVLWQQAVIVCELTEPCRVARIIGLLLERAGAKCNEVDVFIRKQMGYSVSSETELVSTRVSLDDAPSVILRLVKLEPGAGLHAACAAIANA